MSGAEAELHEQELHIADKREQAGEVLRAYYMGERDSLYSALLTMKSWTNFFRVLDYIDIIVSQDKSTLSGYIDQYRGMQDNYKELESKQAELAEMERKLIEQRERVLALEQSVDGELSGRSDSERIRLMIQELTSFWETAGLSEVREYFKALSAAMGKLPAWVQDNKEMLEVKGFNYTIRVPEAKLNEFLREQDERFNNFAFAFEDDSITAHGKRDNMEISVKGHYSIQDEPTNGIIFHVDELLFNGFALPDTTRDSLEEEFDLGFYPELILSFLKANAVEVKDDELVIKLSVSF
ncbi:coiled-coil domain-containing protein [Paenibacillus sp. LHD-117]|uniref:coiled-coil domain-containing protein n=1 Tax=Paenibacillus sp. LHD-117 TaxID=3071412 RepID=UPI0035A86BBE